MTFACDSVFQSVLMNKQTKTATMISVIPLQGQTCSPWKPHQQSRRCTTLLRISAGTRILLLCCRKQEGSEVRIVRFTLSEARFDSTLYCV